MITVKLYGLLRVESGIRELCIEADTVKNIYLQLEKAGLNSKDLKGCYVLINGKPAGKRDKLNVGDVVQLLPPVAGG